MTLQIEFDYFAKEIILDKRALNLNTIYTNFDNQSKIIVFQGTDDNLIDYRLKKKVISKIKNTKFVLVDKKDVDNHMFKSNKHGLDTDFLNMFEFAYEKMGDFVNEKLLKSFDEIQLSETRIAVDYSHGLPVFQFKYDIVWETEIWIQSSSPILHFGDRAHFNWMRNNV